MAADEMIQRRPGQERHGYSPRVWVVSECYPRPSAPLHCLFVHHQLAGLAAAGWDVRGLRPNGWFPPFVWRVAPAWRRARQASIPSAWRPDGVWVRDLRYQNRVPSRLCRPTDARSRTAIALRDLLRREAFGAGVLLSEF